MNRDDLATFLSPSNADDRRAVFEEAATRLGGVDARFVEKDFWVCWTLDALFSDRPTGSPRLLFKGGTSLSKAWGGLIQRFSEDVDVVVFRDDLGVDGSASEIAQMSRKNRERKLDAIKAACQAHVAGPMKESLQAIAARTNSILGADALRIEKASVEDDKDEQTLNVVYPSLFDPDDYVNGWVKIEAGAKSDHDPSAAADVVPYLSSVVEDLDLSARGVTTIRPERTFWDKVVILHGQRAYYEDTGKALKDASKVSRHYYDVHRLMHSPVGARAVEDERMMEACVEHCSVFFNRRNFNFAAARPGTFAIVPPREMMPLVEKDYVATRRMLFGEKPTWAEIVQSLEALEERLNHVPAFAP